MSRQATQLTFLAACPSSLPPSLPPSFPPYLVPIVVEPDDEGDGSSDREPGQNREEICQDVPFLEGKERGRGTRSVGEGGGVIVT
jgi:hypothetical protein